MTEKTTDFSFGYAELNQRGDHIRYLYERDKDAFLSLGFSADFETQLQNGVDASKAIETDEYWKGILSMKRDLVKSTRKALLRSIDMYQLRLKLLLGGDSPEFKSFRFTGASKMKDDELVRYGRNLLQTAERFGETISLAEGMPAFTEGLTEDCNDLDDAIDGVSQTIAQRDEASQKRASVGNELYAMITLVCDAGKRYWNGVNEAYYNDYVIYGSSTPLPQPEEEEETPADGDATDTTSGDEPVA
jgi:hypothetical protein